MKKSFLIILPFLFLTFFSCGLKDTLFSGRTGEVSLTVRENVLSQLVSNVRAADAEEDSLKIKVFLTGDFTDEETQTVDLNNKDSKITFTFAEIPEGATVTANMAVTKGSDNTVLYEGKSEPVTIVAGKTTAVTLTLKVVSDEVPELIPTIEIFLGEDAEPLETANLVEICGAFFYAADVKAANYNYYKNCAANEVTPEVITIKVENWNEDYKFLLNDAELTVSKDKTLDISEILKNTKVGSNGIMVAKGEAEGTEAFSFNVVTGKLDVSDFEFHYGSDVPDNTIVAGQSGVTRVGVEAGKAGNLSVQLTLTNNKTLPANVKTEYQAFGIPSQKAYTVDQPTEEIPYAKVALPVDEITKFGAGIKVTIPDEYTTDLLKEAIKEDAFGCMFRTSYDVTSKGCVYRGTASSQPVLWYITEAQLKNNFQPFIDIQEEELNPDYPCIRGVKDYCFDEYGNLICLYESTEPTSFDDDEPVDYGWFWNVSSFELGSAEPKKVLCKTEPEEYYYCQYHAISYDYDSSTLYVYCQMESMKCIKVLNTKTNAQYEYQIPDWYFASYGASNYKVCVTDNKVYLLAVFFEDNIKYCQIKAYTLPEVPSSVIDDGDPIYVEDEGKIIVDFASLLNISEMEGLDINGMFVQDGCIYIPVGHKTLSKFTGSSYDYHYVAYWRGGIVRIDTNNNNRTSVLGWTSEPHSFNASIRAKAEAGYTGEKSIVYKFSLTNSETDKEAYPYLAVNQYTVLETYTPDNVSSTKQFMYPVCVAAIKPKKLTFVDDGTFIYLDEQNNTFAGERKTNYVTLDLERFAVENVQSADNQLTHKDLTNIYYNSSELSVDTACATVYWDNKEPDMPPTVANDITGSFGCIKDAVSLSGSAPREPGL